MPAGEVDWLARVEYLRALFPQCQHLVQRERLQLPLERTLERRPLLRVEDGVVREIGRGVAREDEVGLLCPALAATVVDAQPAVAVVPHLDRVNTFEL